MDTSKDRKIECTCKRCRKDYTIKINENKLFKPKQYSLFAWWEMKGDN